MTSQYPASNHKAFLMRDGVTPSCVHLPAQSNFITLLDFLIAKFPHIQASEWQQRFHDGLVMSENGNVLSVDSPYLTNQKVYYYRHLTQEIVVPFSHQIIFENQDLLVVDKPHFLPVTPTGQYVQQTLLTRLKKQFNLPDLTPIHRLDKDTAGLILFSKTVSSRALYQQLFAQKQVQKIYYAIAPYRENILFPQHLKLHLERGEPFYTMQIHPDKIANSETQIELIARQGEWGKYQLKPITGKMHQLRVHMNYLGLPLKNDELYPQICHRADVDFSSPLQLLAKSIQFVDPITGQDFYFESEKELLF
ncbi:MULTISPECIES: pseudouridine synthase [unclassified Acinetobacter]|uniref:pseudouridine synthase n=1 Tax=unclassified Acinetobacter TaxID=196816 RepID=UPI0035BB1AE7